MNSRHHLTFKSTFSAEKPKKLAKTSLNVKILMFSLVSRKFLAMRNNVLYSVCVLIEISLEIGMLNFWSLISCLCNGQ